jgi:hypothetical protein
MMTCLISMIAFSQHHTFSGFKHVAIPVFGLVANLVCMAFYLVGPFLIPGMSAKEPFIALGLVALWGVYGLFYFARSSKTQGRAVYVSTPASV